MKTRYINGAAAAAVLLGLAAWQPEARSHQGNDRGPNQDLSGVWLVSAMPYNCTTGDSIPAASFEGLFTFNRDGTMSAWVQNATITTTRGPSHGLWKQRRRGEHAVKFIHLRYNPTTGAYVGRQEAVGTVTVERWGSEFSAKTSTTLYDTNGLVVGGGCATSSGVRLELP